MRPTTFLELNMTFADRYPALKSRNFRLYFLGQTASMIGARAQRVAVAWLAYRITDSVWLLGILGFASGIPMLLLAPFGGVLSDMRDRCFVMRITQSLMLSPSLVLIAFYLRRANTFNQGCPPNQM